MGIGSCEGEKKSLSIAMIGQKRIPSREGGIEVAVQELSTRLVSMGNKVVCYNRRGKSVPYDYCHEGEMTYSSNSYKGVILKPVFTVNHKGFAALTSSISAAFRAAFGKYDIVHFHAEGPCAMLWLPHLFGKRCIATIHGLDWQREKWKNSLGAKYIKFGEKVAAKYADEIIVLSKNVRDYFNQAYKRTADYIPNGVSKPYFRKANIIKESFGLDKNDYFLFLGRIVPEKGLIYLVDAFKKVRTDKKLVIAGGDSSTEKYLLKLKEAAKNDSRIIFTGFVQGEILEELYSNSYVYILPSDLEGMSLGLLEAMSYGNCCLVSDIPECTEVVGDKALIFKKGSREDLEKRISELCNDKNLVAHYKEKTADSLLETFGWEAVVNRTLGIYLRRSLMVTANQYEGSRGNETI
jgi:glycosyltransferase involved in cell wall biosynthesis